MCTVESEAGSRSFLLDGPWPSDWESQRTKNILADVDTTSTAGANAFCGGRNLRQKMTPILQFTK
jgi:hypothetical protein